MLNIHDLKAAYEKAIGHRTSNSTVYFRRSVLGILAMAAGVTVFDGRERWQAAWAQAIARISLV